jgi:type IV fimbrial biogenesis protein FimT
VADPPVMEKTPKNKKSVLSNYSSIFITRFSKLESPTISYSKGFTLIEVLIVFALIGIISAFAVPNVVTMVRSYRLKSAANELASTLQLARGTAISQNANSVLTFNTVSKSYSAFSDNGDGGGTINDGVQNGTEPTTKTVNLQTSYYGEISFNTPSFGNTTVFNSQGMCTPSGTISLQNSVGATIQVVVSPSGSIRVIYP